jgi:hypothetical protein
MRTKFNSKRGDRSQVQLGNEGKTRAFQGAIRESRPPTPFSPNIASNTRPRCRRPSSPRRWRISLPPPVSSAGFSTRPSPTVRFTSRRSAILPRNTKRSSSGRRPRRKIEACASAYFSFLAFQGFQLFSPEQNSLAPIPLAPASTRARTTAPEYEGTGTRHYYEPTAERTFTRRQGKAVCGRAQLSQKRKG